ncbi:hypothetical protein ACPPVW_17160 [Leifsonia sp. McL0607]|uniref:hypothetical protein n=1 Tax=Leifsonia sp. McL0607 TaxID=3415672 RepID=UPI003CF75073
MGETVPLGDLITITRGTTYKSARLGEPGPVLLGLASIARNGGFRDDNLKTYGGDSPEKLLVRPGQLFASLKDVTQSAHLLGSVARVPPRGPLGRLTQDTVRLDIASDSVDPSYLYLNLLTPTYRDYCRSHATGTTNLGLPREDFLAYPVRLPSLDEQRRIAGVPGALDDLIETNRHLARTLEAHMLTLFASEGFDDEPQGNSLMLSELVEVNPKLPKPVGEAAYVDMAALPTDSSRIATVVRRPAVGGARFQNGDTLLARLTPCLENGKAAFVDVLGEDEVAVGSTEFIVLRDRGKLGPHWSYMLTRSGRFRDYAIRHMNGSSGRQRCAPASLESYLVPMPTPDALSRFRKAATSAFDAIGSLNDEIADLTRIRDELLPLLMSGRVRVRSGLSAAASTVSSSATLIGDTQ